MRPAPNHFSLAILMGFIGVIAVGLGLMRNGSWLAGRVAIGVLPLVILVGLLGALVRRVEGSWVGFALFGGSYALLAFGFPAESEYGRRINPMADLVDRFVKGLLPGPGPEPAAPTFNAQFESMQGDRRHLQTVGAGPYQNQAHFSILSTAEMATLKAYQGQIGLYNQGAYVLAVRQANAKVIGHALFALIFALIGAFLGRALERPRSPRPALRGEEG